LDLLELRDRIGSASGVGQTVDALNSDNAKLRWGNVSGSALSMLLSKVLDQHRSDHLIILNDAEEAAYFLSDLEPLLGKRKAMLFPMSYRRPYELEEVDNSNVIQRAELLSRVRSSTSGNVIVTYPKALAEQVVSRRQLGKNTLSISTGETLALETLVEVLFEYHFERVDQVYEPGQFAVRGGIVDIYSFSHDLPYRIELFGDEVDSIRLFDPAEQLSVRKTKTATIVPNLHNEELVSELVPLLEYLPSSTVLWVNDLEHIIAELDNEFSEAQEAFAKLSPDSVQRKPELLYTNGALFHSEIDELSIIEFGLKNFLKNSEKVDFQVNPQPAFNKEFELLQAALIKHKEAGFESAIIAENPGQVERLNTIFEDMPLPKGTRVERPLFTSMVGSLHAGFIDKESKTLVFTDHQIFERFHRFKVRSGYKRCKEAFTLKELSGLNPGDFVTHIDHGVGRYSGLEKMDVNGKEQEAIRLIYRDNDILYVSIHSLHRISKYSGKEGTPPKINKIGSPAWKTLKNKTKSRVKDIAKDLIKLYAKRKSAKGFAFAPDNYMQTELEASFIYVDTPDQEKATLAVKEDMEKEFPMDRLVCGDVGFGKTEVAIRAAFKSVCDSKQVAVLVPTTILALQHYHTFKNRLKDLPCRVEYINRLRTKKDQTAILKDLEAGKVDILIGTHRIVGKDVQFKDLGLLILDEEQKFGVAVKEKLRNIKVNVDTLTLTATPIPRTLQFSLMGARDLSTISTPPPNRVPVLTELHTFSEELIRDAVKYEKSRGGQVFFVNNRVENIQEVAGMIKRLCPDVRVCIGHGQMDAVKLEDTMLRFIEGEYDVLVATTIIESGLDIPNANTMIINNANNFGLSDLHQLRGRVGRSDRKAFCYLLAPPTHMLTSEAKKRLTALSEFSDLGSGFNIAMRDLDIRGAGNLLGAEQSGFISDIGFDMYHKILDEAMQELKQGEFQELYKDEEKDLILTDCQLDTDLEILLPDDYVNNITERLKLYRELDDIKKEEELQKFLAGMEDRFGKAPEPALRMFDAVRLRWAAGKLGFARMRLKNGIMSGSFVADQASPFYQSPIFGHVIRYVQANPNRIQLKEKNGKLSLSFGQVNSVKRAKDLVEAMVPAIETVK
jgi:transcription-repair coupling factor (superfamily II helicase)